MNVALTPANSVTGVQVALLGPVTCTVDGAVVSIAGAKQRAVLATLALSAGRVVPAGALVEALWSDDPPSNAEHSLQQHVSTLRKALSRDETTALAALATRAPGYLLDATVDVDEFEAIAGRGRAAVADHDWHAAAAAYAHALGLWRGDALVDIQGSGRLRAAAIRLDEHRIEVLEASLEARLHLGEHSAAVKELEALVQEHPLREGLWALLMLALYRCRRQADALTAYQRARAALVEQLGIEPGPALRDLEQAILSQRADLDLDSPLVNADIYATYRADPASTPRLVLADGQIVVLPLGAAVVGRDATATVRLVDSRVSRRHAELVTTKSGTVLRDLGSTNGTTVNRSPVERSDLQHGDVVGIGGYEVEFRTD